jgi:hypothetical protein
MVLTAADIRHSIRRVYNSISDCLRLSAPNEQELYWFKVMWCVQVAGEARGIAVGQKINGAAWSRDDDTLANVIKQKLNEFAQECPERLEYIVTTMFEMAAAKISAR